MPARQLDRKMQKGSSIEFVTRGPRPRVTLVAPRSRPIEITPTRSGNRYRVEYSQTDEEGMYVFTVQTGRKVSKQWFAVGDVVFDWVPASFALRDEGRYVEHLITSFSQMGNVVVAHSLCSWRGTEYPSRAFRTAESVRLDPVELILCKSADVGVAVLLAYHWVPETDVDMWRHPGEKQVRSARKMIRELHGLYATHPSMGGFYCYWEPGDVLQRPYYEATTRYIKSIDPGLLTGAAPYIFSTDRYHGGTLPLMPAALSSVDTLDFIVPQSSVAVYPYPINRTKDHLALTVASTSRKPTAMAVGHVETFPRYFVEGERLLPSDVIIGQIFSASLTRGASGIATFVYSYVADRENRALAKLREAIAFFRRTADLRRSPRSIAAFIPLDPTYWPTMGTRVLRRLRSVGLDVDLIQAPLHSRGGMGQANVVLLLDPPELEAHEAAALAETCRSGSSLIVLGYPPSGLREVLGVESRNVGKYGGLKLTKRIGPRIKEGEIRRFGFELVFCPTLLGARPLGVFESIPPGFQPGAFSVTKNKFGRGTAYFVGVPSLATLERIPELLLDLIEEGSPPGLTALSWEIRGLSEDSDLITSTDSMAMVNLGEQGIQVGVRYKGPMASKRICVVDFIGKRERSEDINQELDIALEPFRPTLLELVD